MGEAPIYLDGFATLPLAPEARDAMLKVWEQPGNAGAPNASGERAARQIAHGRGEVAALIGAAQTQAATLLKSFREFAEENSLGKLQEVYSGFFDLNSICHPNVGYQLFGENYKRSVFLVSLKKRYRDTGFEANAEEISEGMWTVR